MKSLVALLLLATAVQAAELKEGRYVGWVKLTEANERIALVADIYRESPEELTQFPSRNALLKLTLGGYNTHEYLTLGYENIQYDFDNGDLTFDEPDKDLVITAKAQATETQSYLVGDVFVRSSAAWGTLYLKYDSSEPLEEGEVDPGAGETAPFIGVLEGQYEGTCAKNHAILQLQTVRGLKTKLQTILDKNGLGSEYGIAGRISGSAPDVCGVTTGKGIYCTTRNYGGGSYNPWLGTITLQSLRATDSCTLRGGELRCQISLQGNVRQECVMKKASAPKPARFFRRNFHLSPDAAQMAELPAPAAPKHAELAARLRGKFSGYLHNETNDTYHAVILNVIPYTASNNPHNPNQMMVSTTLSTYMGEGLSGPFTTQTFGSRSFYLRPGFTLSGEHSDAFVSISEWKQGFVRGVVYSHSFGRVGTVELSKGGLPPASGIRFVDSFPGTYSARSAQRLVELNFPAQPDDMVGNVVKFTGTLQSAYGILATEHSDGGSFDPYTGKMAWLITRGDYSTYISGYLESPDVLKVYWPPAPDKFGVWMGDFVYEEFSRVKRKP